MAQLSPVTALAPAIEAPLVRAWLRCSVRQNESRKRIHDKEIQTDRPPRQYLETYKLLPFASCPAD